MVGMGRKKKGKPLASAMRFKVSPDQLPGLTIENNAEKMKAIMVATGIRTLNDAQWRAVFSAIRLFHTESAEVRDPDIAPLLKAARKLNSEIEKLKNRGDDASKRAVESFFHHHLNGWPEKLGEFEARLEQINEKAKEGVTGSPNALDFLIFRLSEVLVVAGGIVSPQIGTPLDHAFIREVCAQFGINISKEEQSVAARITDAQKRTNIYGRIVGKRCSE